MLSMLLKLIWRVRLTSYQDTIICIGVHLAAANRECKLHEVII